MRHPAEKTYDSSDRSTLAALVEECEEMLRRAEAFRASLEKQRREMYKSFGLEVQDIRLGGPKNNTESPPAEVLSCRGRFRN